MKARKNQQSRRCKEILKILLNNSRKKESHAVNLIYISLSRNIFPTINLKIGAFAMSVTLYPSCFDSAILLGPIQAHALTWTENECLFALLALPFDYVLDNEREDSACYALGQRFFDKFKAESHGRSLAAKKSLQRVCDAIPFHCTEYGRERKEHVSKAWEGIG
jgi:hypothetical protein